MGQALVNPVTDKHSSACQDEKFKVGASCMQGWRCTMEDSHTHILSLPEDPGTAFFAVYDGHGGSSVAEYASKHLHKYIVQRPEYKQGNIEESLKQGFLDLDAVMQKEAILQKEASGSTAVTILIKDDVLYCANAGDSRAVASINGKAEDLSVDHKPNKESELSRIVAGGGRVEFNRVNGILALSRAFGDFVYKKNADVPPEKQIVTAYPDVVVRKITKDWEFIVLACDGIWDVVSSQDVVDYCQQGIVRETELNNVCERLMDGCLAPNSTMGGLGCDNMTIMLVCLTPGITYAQLQEKLRQNVQNLKVNDTDGENDGWPSLNISYKYGLLYSNCGESSTEATDVNNDEQELENSDSENIA